MTDHPDRMNAAGTGAALMQGVIPYLAMAGRFWGDDWGLLQDPFGIRWAILEPGSPA